MEALLAFVATLVSLRLSADLVRRHRQPPRARAARVGRRARGLRRRLGGDRVGLGGRLEQPGVPRLLPLRRPSRRGAARRRLAAAGGRPLGRAADARLRRPRDRRRRSPCRSRRPSAAARSPRRRPISRSSRPGSSRSRRTRSAPSRPSSSPLIGPPAAPARQRADPRRARRGRARQRARRPRQGGVVAVLGRRRAAALRRLRPP